MKIVPDGAISTIVLCVLVGLADSQTETQECRPVEFRCQNGDCIPSERLCDGRADCSDQSDETREECTKPQFICPRYAFRCNYGACIDGDAPCNGIDECVDRSDELLPRCRNAFVANSTIQQSCTIDEFRCNDGQCVPGTGWCDGNVDCSDRSDETRQLCGSNPCPSFNFRCAYGACVDSMSRCNGKVDCADGSDEDPELCRGQSRPIFTTTERPYNQPTEAPWRPPPTPTQSSSQHLPPCPAPSQPQNGRWRLYKSQNKVRTDEPLAAGTKLLYSCNAGYKIKGSEDVFCGPEEKWSNKPVCIEITCEPLVRASIQAESCNLNEEWASCEGAVLPGTVALISCRVGYRQESTSRSTPRQSVRCNSRGQWVPEPIRCVPECGKATSSTAGTIRPLIVDGMLPNITDFPWHATLYRRSGSSGRKAFKCGATIIETNLLITAAHCVYDGARGRVDDPKKYVVATGNIFQDFDSPFHDATVVKKSNVSHIHMLCNYVGSAGNYAYDIAILHIDPPFVFTSLLMPACLDFQQLGVQSALEVGKLGKVAGFGKTVTGQASQVLQYINVPVVSIDECGPKNATRDSVALFTIDKLCAGYTNGSSVCGGDSGGGLVFNWSGLWYLRGIVSVGVGQIISEGTRRCDNYKESLYTKVSVHIQWIQKIMTDVEKYNRYPACSARTNSH